MFEMILLFVVTASVDVDVHSIEIESDNATHSVQESRYEWTGNVVVTEPAYTLTASTVIVYLDEMQEPCKVTAVGKPVEAFGPYEGENATVSGEVILYDCEREKIRIARNATVNVPSESMSLKADNIIYDEPPRVYRRLQILEDWSDEQIKSIFPRGQGTRSAHGFGT